MKKLTLILSTILLMSSTAAFARSKTSKAVKANMNNPAKCQRILKTLREIDFNEKDLQLVGSCKGSLLSTQWKVKYLRNPSQKFKIKLGSESPNYPEGKEKRCEEVTKVLQGMSDFDFSYNVGCDQRVTYRIHEGGLYFVDSIRYTIEGEISIKK